MSGGRIIPLGQFRRRRDEAIRTLYAKGVTLEAIAFEVGYCNASAVSHAIRRMGLPPRPRRAHFWTPEMLELVRRLLAKGKTLEQIGTRLGRTPQAVQMALHRDQEAH